MYSNLGTDVPYDVPTKCCCFLSGSEFQYGRLGLLLADIFSGSSQERLKGSYPNLAQMFLIGFRPSVVTFKVDQNSNMAPWPLIA